MHIANPAFIDSPDEQIVMPINELQRQIFCSAAKPSPSIKVPKNGWSSVEIFLPFFSNTSTDNQEPRLF